MFKRRKPLTPTQIAKQAVWPDMGLKRTLIYIKYRILRLSDSSHKIALGLAIGFGVSFTPILGTHFLQAGLFAFLCRGNVLSAIIGTFVGNPWTFPFFWWAGFSSGKAMYDLFGISGAAEFPEGMDPGHLIDLLWAEPMSLFMPWMLGGYTLCLISVPIGYFIYLNIVRTAKRARAKTLAQK